MIDFFERLGRYMGIMQSPYETRDHYSHRLMFSAASAWMQTCIYTPSKDEVVSEVSVKTIVRKKMHEMQEIARTENKFDPAALTDYVYEVLLDNGAFYKTPYRMRPAPHRLIGCEHAALVRGMYPDEDVQWSGMAPFVKNNVDDSEVYEAFSLPGENPDILLQQTWRRLPSEEDVRIEEYLNINRKISEPYYIRNGSSFPSLTMGRNRRDPDHYDYYLVRGSEIRRLTDDMQVSRMHEYCRLAIMTKHQAQYVKTVVNSSLVNVEIGYWLPQPELRFLRYIAWPDPIIDLKQGWNYTIHPELWPTFKKRMQFLNYSVEESHE